MNRWTPVIIELWVVMCGITSRFQCSTCQPEGNVDISVSVQCGWSLTVCRWTCASIEACTNSGQEFGIWLKLRSMTTYVTDLWYMLFHFWNSKDRLDFWTVCIFHAGFHTQCSTCLTCSTCSRRHKPVRHQDKAWNNSLPVLTVYSRYNPDILPELTWWHPLM